LVISAGHETPSVNHEPRGLSINLIVADDRGLDWEAAALVLSILDDKPVLTLERICVALNQKC
jgi:hypothetical protein